MRLSDCSIVGVSEDAEPVFVVPPSGGAFGWGTIADRAANGAEPMASALMSIRARARRANRFLFIARPTVRRIERHP